MNFFSTLLLHFISSVVVVCLRIHCIRIGFLKFQLRILNVLFKRKRLFGRSLNRNWEVYLNLTHNIFRHPWPTRKSEQPNQFAQFVYDFDNIYEAYFSPDTRFPLLYLFARMHRRKNWIFNIPTLFTLCLPVGKKNENYFCLSHKSFCINQC